MHVAKIPAQVVKEPGECFRLSIGQCAFLQPRRTINAASPAMNSRMLDGSGTGCVSPFGVNDAGTNAGVSMLGTGGVWTETDERSFSPSRKDEPASALPVKPEAASRSDPMISNRGLPGVGNSNPPGPLKLGVLATATGDGAANRPGPYRAPPPAAPVPTTMQAHLVTVLTGGRAAMTRRIGRATWCRTTCFTAAMTGQQTIRATPIRKPGLARTTARHR